MRKDKDIELIGIGFYLILVELEEIKKKLKKMEGSEMADLKAIQDKLAATQEDVQKNTDAVASASALLDQISQLLRDSATDPAAIQAIADSLDATNAKLDTNNSSLADAVARNTPASPEPAPTPVPVPTPAPEPVPTPEPPVTGGDQPAPGGDAAPEATPSTNTGPDNPAVS